MNELLSEVITKWNSVEPEIAFEKLLYSCLCYGSVIVRPDRIIIARECYSDGNSVFFDSDNVNCWFIYAAAQVKGLSLHNFIKDAYKNHEYVAFQRRRKCKVYKFSELSKKV
jgi:hypothetical protein